MSELNCSFTGHRLLGDDFDIELLENVIEGLAKRGTQNFYCGMAKGFDMAAAEIVLKYKKKYSLKLIACIPFEGQSDSFSRKDKERYSRILQNCDEKVVFSENYSVECMHARNRYLVENCDVLISYLRTEKGGTFYTVNYARACEKKIIEV